MVSSVRFSSLCNLRISSAGILEPAAIPVRKCSKPSRAIDPSWSSSNCAENIVGTEYNAVHFSSWTLLRVATGLKASDGKTIADPCVAVAMYPRIHPKQ